jgi:hypothetical protein
VLPLATATRGFVSPAPLVLGPQAVQMHPIASVEFREELAVAQRSASALPAIAAKPAGPLARMRTAATAAAPAQAIEISTPGNPALHGRLDLPRPGVQTLHHVQPSAVPAMPPAAVAPALSVSREPETVQQVVQPAGAGAAAGGGEARSDAELDELAARLYDRFRSRLRMELLVSRERAGMATDLR